MKQQIKLTTEKSDTIFVEDVNVSKGVYFKGDDNFGFVMPENEGYNMFFIDDGQSVGSSMSFIELIKTQQTSVDFYTLDGRRIVTERELTVEDIRNDWHLGFVHSGGQKGYIVGVDRYFAMIDYSTNSRIGTYTQSMKKLLFIQQGISFDSVFKFDSIKYVHLWLAE